MSGSTGTPTVNPLGSGFRSSRSRRLFYAGSIALVFAGLVLGSAYGGPAAPFTLLVAFFFGGVLYYQGKFLRGREAYGNVIIGLLAGGVFSSLAISSVVSLWLGIPILNVVSATALDVFLNAVTVSLVGFAGFAVAITFGFLGVGTRRERLALVLLGGGIAGYVLVLLQLGQLLPDTGRLSTAILSQSATDQKRLFQLAGAAVGAIAFAGFGSLVTSRDRLRTAFVGLLVVSLAVGAYGVGNVQAQINHAQTAQSVNDRISISVSGLGVTDDALELTVTVDNPTPQAVALQGSYLRAFNDTSAQLAYGAGRPVDGETSVVVQPGERRTVDYEVPLTRAQVDRLRAAMDAGPTNLSGRLSLALPNSGSAITPDAGSFVAHFRCTVTADGDVECETA